MNSSTYYFTTKWYNFQEDMKICKTCEKKGMANVIHTIFSCNRHDNIRRKTFIDMRWITLNCHQEIG